MPTTLEDVRDRFRRAAKGLPDEPKPAKAVPVATAVRRAVPPRGQDALEAPPARGRATTPWGSRLSKYTLTPERDDAILAFSKRWKGAKVSELAQTEEGRGFLGWIVRTEFADWPLAEREELKQLARAYLGMPTE